MLNHCFGSWTLQQGRIFFCRFFQLPCWSHQQWLVAVRRLKCIRESPSTMQYLAKPLCCRALAHQHRCFSVVHVSSDRLPEKRQHGITWGFGTGSSASEGFAYPGEVRGECPAGDGSEELATVELTSCIYRNNCKPSTLFLHRGAIAHVSICLHEYVSSRAV